MELCRILGISLNEFIAGEDIREESAVARSEENLVRVAAYGKQKQKSLKKIVAALAAAALLALAALAGVLLKDAALPQSYIRPLSSGTAEGRDGLPLAGSAACYEYRAGDAYKDIFLDLTIYENGRKTAAYEGVKRFAFGDASARSGLLSVFCGSGGRIRFTHMPNGYGAAAAYDVDLAEYASFDMGDTFAQSVAYNDDTASAFGIEPGAPFGLLACCYDEDGRVGAAEPQEVLGGERLPGTDYAYVFSLRFEK